MRSKRPKIINAKFTVVGAPRWDPLAGLGTVGRIVAVTLTVALLAGLKLLLAPQVEHLLSLLLGGVSTQ